MDIRVAAVTYTSGQDASTTLYAHAARGQVCAPMELLPMRHSSFVYAFCSWHALRVSGRRRRPLPLC